MRSSVITGSLLFAVGAILVLPALSARPRSGRTARPVAPAQAREAVLAPTAPARVAAPFPAELHAAAALARRAEWAQALLALATVDASSPRVAALRDTLAAEALSRLGEWEQAEAAAGRAMKAAGTLEPHLRARAAFVAGEAREAAGDPSGAAPFFDAAGRGTPVLARAAREREARALLFVDAEAALDVIAADADAADARPGTLAAAAAAATAAGETGRALTWLRRLQSAHPTSPEARVALLGPILTEDTRAALTDGRVGAVLARADVLLEAGFEQAAAPDIAAAVAAGVPAAHAATLAQLQGRLLRMRGQNAQALVHLARAAASKEPVGCRAAFHAVRAAKSLRRSADAAQWRARAAAGCPCDWRDRAALELASEAQAEHPEIARAHWKRLAETGATPATRVLAAWRLGWTSYLAGRRDEASGAFAALVQAAPESREAAASRYWSARMARDAGDTEAARSAMSALAADFPREWYGLLAAEEAGDGIPPPPACAVTDFDEGLASAALAIAPDGGVARALLDVEALGLVEAALAEADGSNAAAPERAAFRALVLSRAGRSREALREFRRAVPDWRRRADVPAALACVAWPIEHEKLLRASARASGLAPALVFGLVHQESVFDETAISHAGARGLMQVMPATGQTIAKWLGERVTTAKLLDPALNARYGATYLRRLLDESGRVEVALAGYNAGPGRARRWWAAAQQDVPLFVESIPFDETRDYVKAIAVNERLYRTRLGGAAGAAAGQ